MELSSGSGVQHCGNTEVARDRPHANVVKIISRYVLKEHFGPFAFALTALTSLMLLQYIARQFGNLVGKGLQWSVIMEFFLLSIPFTVAMTLPMAVLVAVLYAFSRLASENEITALKAGGVSMRQLLVLIGRPPLPVGRRAGLNQGIRPHWPTSRPGQLCAPKTASIGNFSNRPSRIISRAPPPPSSAGWNNR